MKEREETKNMEKQSQTAEEKKIQLFLNQKHTLDLFLERNAISQTQYDKSLGDLTKKWGWKRHFNRQMKTNGSVFTRWRRMEYHHRYGKDFKKGCVAINENGEPNMSELEKLKSLQPFNTDDPEVMEAKKYARKLTNEFNNSDEEDPEGRTAILKKLFGDCTDNIFIKPPFRCDYGFNIHVGRKFFANYDCIMLDAGPINIGDNCLLGPMTCIYTVSHDINPKKRAAGMSFAKPVTIGNDVWIGGNCIILPGVTIGDNAIVGAGSVVTKNVPKNAVIAGNPARILRYLENDEINCDSSHG